MPLIRSNFHAEDAGPATRDAVAPADGDVLLAAPTAGERRAAVHALEDSVAGQAALCRRLAVETSASVREAILAALIRHRSPAIAAALLPLLRTDEAPLRNAAIEALAEMPDEVAPHVEALLADPDSDVRIFAGNMLGVLPHPRAAEWLLTALADDHVNVCAAAIDGLAEIGAPSTADALEAVPARFPGNSFVAFAVRIAVRRIRGC
ncbi:HEAT repeat domain-containing protein [Sphingomonas sp. 8AM]|uniref:HEAT repeat domain-containing protein n=1 Tax=Sphingomonas sp. 8AM TaxID=2653170 RepID=UPI0012F3055B|nr:HEAT repeat domain-containing protein [Sphingomonas sp. 8AM]VXC32161.1 HEAT repeat domain protein [Sphingomonas sp. 8AM]